jgi:AraC-like DNA-binding protein
MLFLQSAPHVTLQKYISQYLYISLNSAELPSLKQTFLPYDIPSVTFFVGPVFLDPTKKEATCAIEPDFSQSVTSFYVGMVTSPFSIYFQEKQAIKAFMIPFKPSGFSALFGRDVAELTDQIPSFSLLVGASEAARFSEQLILSNNFATQVKLMDDFFLKRISRYQPQASQIAEACRRLSLSYGLERMTDLALHTNMSLRNLERQFTERVGVSPKTFARFKRLHRALTLMHCKQPPSWADIAHECGYYDQAHFTKEFKALTNHPPSVFLLQEYALYNQFILFPQFPTF